MSAFADMGRRARALPLGWWGAVLLAATEATVFGALIAAYFYLRVGATEWPMGGIEPPDVLVPTLLTVALVLTSVPMALAARAALHGRSRATWMLVLVALVVQVAYLVVQLVLYLDDLGTFLPSENAYASSYYVLLGVHHAHVIAGILLGAWCVGRLWLGGLTPYRVTAVRVAAVYWHFVNLMAIAVLLTELSPRL